MEVSFNSSKISNIKRQLKELQIPFKSNLRKRDLYDLLAARKVAAPLVKSKENISAVITIQAAWRGRYTRKMLALRGNAAFCRELCSNDIDPISLDPVKDLPMKVFFSYMADDGRYYGFDINSLKKCLNNGQTKNPFNREDFSCMVIHQIHLCYDASTKEQDTELSLPAKGRRCNRKFNTKEKAFEIFHNFHLASGFFIDENWFLDLNRANLVVFFQKLYQIIRIRSPMAFFEMCEEQNPSWDFFELYDKICMGIYNTSKMRQLILEALENVVNSQIDKTTAIIWILLALTQVSEPASMQLSFLV